MSAAKPTLLSDDELTAMFERLDTPEKGRLRIQHIRESLPGRVTQSNRYSGKLRFPSLKMGFTLEAEAFSTEGVAITEWEHDNETYEIYTQPAEKLKITYVSAETGKRITVYTTPDAFRITRDGFIFTECKTKEFLLAERAKKSTRYVRGLDGKWRSPCAEEVAKALGCVYEVRSTEQNNYVALENLELLSDFYCSKAPGVPEQMRHLLADRLKGKAYVSAFDLIHIEPCIDADSLYTMLCSGDVYFPLHALRLVEQEKALFFRSQSAWHAHEAYVRADQPDRRRPLYRTELRPKDVFTWDGVKYEVVNCGADNVCARTLDAEPAIIQLSNAHFDTLAGKDIVFECEFEPADNTEAEERYKQASPEDLQEAHWRYQILFGVPDRDNPLKGRKERIRFGWLKRYRDHEERYGNGFLGLLPERHGNREPKVKAESKALALKIILEDWETYRNKGRRTSYGRYLETDEVKRGIVDPVSYVTFCAYIKARAGHAQKVALVGEKAAYDWEPQYLELDRTTPRNGTHSWHIGHIDHTPLPLKFLYGDEQGGPADTIWLTTLIGAFDRQVLARYLCFDEPSYRSCMMVIRDCVRRHGRVPQYIVTDGGSDFQSVYYETLLSRLKCKKRERRRGKPRDGSVCERIFDTTQEQFITKLLGDTSIVERHYRAISPALDPVRRAVWILDKFDERFEQYLSDVYHSNYHSGIDMSPNDAAALSLRSHGARAFHLIRYDDQFLAETCPSTKKGRVKIQPEGVKVNYLWYKGPELHKPGRMGTSVPVRFDPMDSGRAFVLLDRRWVTVMSEYQAIFKGKSEREIRFATSAMLQIARKRGEKAVINAQNIAKFLMTTEAQEATARQARNDAESKNYRDKINQPTASSPTKPVGAARKAPPSATKAPPRAHTAPKPRAGQPEMILEDL